MVIMTRTTLPDNVQEFMNVLQSGLDQAGIDLEHVHGKIIEGTAAAKRYGTSFVFSQHLIEDWDNLASNEELLSDVIIATAAGLRFKSGALLPFHLHQTPGVVAAMCIVAIILQEPIRPPVDLK
tara:strand:- start:212 stop:583 length:372 start_codon:yes stop_codon:yes gene_type:complete